MRSFFLLGFIVLLLSACAVADTEVVLQGITFKPDTISMVAGNVVQLEPEYRPKVFSGIPITWSSSDPQIATVTQGGLLYAVNPGKVWITIKDQNSSTSGKCYIIIQ